MEEIWSSLYWDVGYVIVIVALLAAIMFMIHEKFCKDEKNCKNISLTLGIVSTPRFCHVMDVYFFLLICAGAANAVLLLRAALDDSGSSGLSLLYAGFGVLTINVLSFGLIYWWIDGGGPVVRLKKQVTQWDFQFPQQLAQGSVWEPTILDYLYVAYTNILAFSPTDAMPLTHRVKLLFTVQSAISVLTVVITVGHAINVLSS